MGISHKNRTFSGVYKAIKFICAARWALSQTQMTDSHMHKSLNWKKA